jgi:hypothetical protein
VTTANGEYEVHGVWYMVHGVWCVVCGVWCVVYGAWCMVHTRCHTHMYLILAARRTIRTGGCTSSPKRTRPRVTPRPSLPNEQLSLGPSSTLPHL